MKFYRGINYIVYPFLERDIDKLLRIYVEKSLKNSKATIQKELIIVEETNAKRENLA